jgi:hypothetical protein
LIKGYFSNAYADICLLRNVIGHTRASFDSAEGDMWPELRTVKIKAVCYQILLCNPVKVKQMLISLENQRNDVSA